MWSVLSHRPGSCWDLWQDESSWSNVDCFARTKAQGSDLQSNDKDAWYHSGLLQLKGEHWQLQKVSKYSVDLNRELQWGSENRPCPVFGWSNVDRFTTVHKWSGFRMAFENRTEMSSFQTFLDKMAAKMYSFWMPSFSKNVRFSNVWFSRIPTVHSVFKWSKVVCFSNCPFLVCTFSWKENKYYNIQKCLIWGFMCNKKSLIQIQDLEDRKLLLHLNNHN